MYCHQCGKEVGDAKFCPYCGTKLKAETEEGYYEPIHDQSQYQYQYQQPPYYRPDDAPHFGYALLSFFIPIVGIILFVIWNQEYPLRAKSCLKGFIAGIIVSVIGICCFLSVIGTADDYYGDEYYRDYDMYYDSIVEVIPYE